MRQLSRTIAVTISAFVASACGQAPVVTSAATATAQVGQPFSYQIAATNSPTSFAATVPPPAGLAVNASGLISGTPSEAGSFGITVSAQNASGTGTQSVALVVNPAPVSVAVVRDKELFVTHPDVIGDTRATSTTGAWHFRTAMGRIAAANGQPLETFVKAWIDTWRLNTTVPGATETFATRTATADALQAAWDGNRIRLIAIVNRLDLTKFTGNVPTAPSALGEGRLVYELTGVPRPFTIILEFKLPLKDAAGQATADVGTALRGWAARWHALGAIGGPAEFNEAYRVALQRLTDDYAATGTLNQLRTNEFVTMPWELREFHAQGTPIRMVQAPVAETPAIGSHTTAALGQFLNANAAGILAGTAVSLPASLQGAVAPVASPPFRWNVPGVDPRVNFIMSFKTCSGCHAGDTNTLFQHIGQNAPNRSTFLTQTIMLAHPLPNRPTAELDEMGDREDFLEAMLASQSPADAPAAAVERLAEIIASRANRVH